MSGNWFVERFEEVSATGRTRPMLATCVLLDPESAEGAKAERRPMLVKALGLPHLTEQGLFAEYFGSRLAAEFGIDAPRTEIVDVSDVLLEASGQQLAAWNVSPAPGLAVGVEHRRGLIPLNPDTPINEATEVAEALRIYAFDLLTQNPDRRSTNPNCAIYQGRFVAYDFEMAFSFLFPVVGAGCLPWEVSDLGFATSHVFHKWLGRALREGKVDLQILRDGLGRLTQDRLEQLSSFLPHQWSEFGTTVVEHLTAARGRPDEFTAHVERSLS